MPALDALPFDNSFSRLPGDFYALQAPTPLPAPHLVSFNPDAAALIGLDPTEARRADFVDYFAGNRPLPGASPLAALYAGHQFGHYVPQLGDGRAILLGEVAADGGARWEMQLKGAGQTPWSRFADGRAVLRSSIREYLCSEAMHALGIPTTRALCLVGSDHPVRRETVETAAVVTRLAPSFVRFGSFEVFFYRRQYDKVALLADYVIGHDYPHLAGLPDRFERLLREVVLRTARLVAHWQAAGFAHGVLNTDNMSILGLTLDYGPFGFMDGYDPAFICNHSDTHGRYAFANQPAIGLWNLHCLAQALIPNVSKEAALAALADYQPAFDAHWLALMRAKLGLDEARGEDGVLVQDLLALMAGAATDYTVFFRRLASFGTRADAANGALRDMVLDRAGFDVWAARYRRRLAAENSADAERAARMNRVNPKYVLRNYMAEIAIHKATEDRDFSEVDRLLRLLQAPYDEHPGMESYAGLPPDWARHISVSCSS